MQHTRKQPQNSPTRASHWYLQYNLKVTFCAVTVWDHLPKPHEVLLRDLLSTHQPRRLVDKFQDPKLTARCVQYGLLIFRLTVLTNVSYCSTYGYQVHALLYINLCIHPSILLTYFTALGAVLSQLWLLKMVSTEAGIECQRS